MKASDLLVKCLETEGVEYVFTVPGEEVLHLLESLRESRIKVVTNRHEQCSAFMAATYGRLTGRPGVCMSTLGPGATNLTTGIAHAQLGGFPMVVLTGQKPIRGNWQGNFQVIDIVNLMGHITKRSVQVKDPTTIPREVRTAFKSAMMERRGPCLIEIPEDIAAAQVDDKFQPHPPTPTFYPVAGAEVMSRAADLIRHSNYPLVIVSSRAQRGHAWRSLRRFCDRTNIYVVHTQMGKGVLGDNHPNSLFAFGIHKHDLVNCAVDRADLLITVGYNTVEFPPAVWNRELKKKILDINFAPGFQDIYNPPSLEVVGDIAATLERLAEELRGYSYDSSYFQTVKRELERFLFIEGVEEDGLRPRRIVSD